MFDKGLYKKLEKILSDLRDSCMLPDGSENAKKGGQLLDVYALEIQMHMERKDRKKTKELYEKGMYGCAAHLFFILLKAVFNSMLTRHVFQVLLSPKTTLAR